MKRFKVLTLLTGIVACGVDPLVSRHITDPLYTKGIRLDESINTSLDAEKECFQAVNAKETSGFKEVVSLMTKKGGLCTGTFVSDQVLLTAAHCLDSSSTGGLTYRRVSSLEVLHFGKTGDQEIKVEEDFAIVRFPPNTSRFVARFTTGIPHSGVPLIMVGYGQTDLIQDNPVDGMKRYGYNVIDQVSGDNRVLTFSSPKDFKGHKPGEETMTARGDSGGPILNVKGELMGIVSKGTIGEDNLRDYDHLLTNKVSLALLNRAATMGWPITGLEVLSKTVESGAKLPIESIDKFNLSTCVP